VRRTGRWSYVSRNFRTAKRHAFRKGARNENGAGERLAAPLRYPGVRPDGALGEISEKFERLGAVSDTEGDWAICMRSSRPPSPISTVRSRRAPRRWGPCLRSTVVPVGAELFDTAGTFERFLHKLLDSYAMDAIENEEGSANVPSIEEAAAFLRSIQSAAAETFAALGEGHDIRLRGRGVAGAALVSAERVIHLAAFAEARALE